MARRSPSDEGHTGGERRLVGSVGYSRQVGTEAAEAASVGIDHTNSEGGLWREAEVGGRGGAQAARDGLPGRALCEWEIEHEA